MIRLRGVAGGGFARGTSYPKLYPIVAGYIAGELSFTGTLLGRTRPSLMKRHIQSRLRGASHRASLECLVCEARRQRLMFEARLRQPCYNITGQTGVKSQGQRLLADHVQF